MNFVDRGITVFCSSSDAAPAAYRRAAVDLGRALAERGAIVVYGGASVGLMGALATAALDAGGRVVGVIPQRLVDRELAHGRLTELHVVETMHERKAIMSDRAAGYVVLPGGFGTYEEFFEVVTWKQLGMHTKPVVLLNTDGFYDPLLAQIDRAITERVIRPEYRSFVRVAATVDEVLAHLAAAEPDAGPSGRSGPLGSSSGPSGSAGATGKWF